MNFVYRIHKRGSGGFWKVLSTTDDVLYYVTPDRRLARRIRRYYNLPWTVLRRGECHPRVSGLRSMWRGRSYWVGVPRMRLMGAW